MDLLLLNKSDQRYYDKGKGEDELEVEAREKVRNKGGPPVEGLTPYEVASFFFFYSLASFLQLVVGKI